MGRGHAEAPPRAAGIAARRFTPWLHRPRAVAQFDQGPPPTTVTPFLHAADAGALLEPFEV